MRVSIGSFSPEQVDEIERLLEESEHSLRPAIERLAGNHGYYVGIDRGSCTMTNTSVWESLEHAKAMATLPEMLALRDTFQRLGVHFQPIANLEVLWRL